MKATPSQRPNKEMADKPHTAHLWLLREQQCLAEQVGEPVFVTIRLVYDGFVEVDVETCTGRHGMAGGNSLPETLAAAVETLLFLDAITGISAR